ncbi:MAG: glucosaminidase domain-containing protein [Sulfurovaceae bacterium]|nr:glucosaminidase domain-containing protein [Sulfurovaceae bacterium]
MIKYFLIFLSITISAFSFENRYFTEEINPLKKYSNYEKNFWNIESKKVDLYTKQKKSCNKFAKTIDKKISTPNDITIFKSKEIKPINYTNTISLNKLQVSDKKQKFFHMLLPAILISKQKFKVLRTRAKNIIKSDNPSSEDLAFLDKMYKKFKTTDNKELLSRMKTHPVSIVLAQAAIESAWGESRFFKKGNNIFGMWSYNRHEPRMRARETRKGKVIYLKKYKTLSDAIDDYFVTIGRGAYKSFRKHRDITKDPLQLVQYLVNYCELKDKYTRRLRRFIIKNRLTKFDKFKIDKKYI